jgi:hypothetical protein
MKVRGILLLFVVGSACSAANANEQTAYSYDAQGQLIQVVKSDTVNSGVIAQYTYNKTTNRLREKLSGPPNGSGS